LKHMQQEYSWKKYTLGVYRETIRKDFIPGTIINGCPVFGTVQEVQETLASILDHPYKEKLFSRIEYLHGGSHIKIEVGFGKKKYNNNIGFCDIIVAGLQESGEQVEKILQETFPMIHCTD
ncbi:hypothetical protein MK079_05450, partial [Candidatus Gracilibacteria bacterium]|nr:hypothetical protein [Candidatus Gracilibacteria bacterium]